MNSKIGMISSFMFGLVLATGCESVALMPRPDVDETLDRRRSEPAPAVGRVDRSRGEVTGRVERVDEGRREIHVRTEGQNLRVFRYDPRTLVYDRERDLKVGDLRDGDEVTVQPSGGANDEQYADVIRILDRRSDARYRR
jgi:hypothetical protein